MTDISPEEVRQLRRGGGLRDRLRRDMAAARAAPRPAAAPAATSELPPGSQAGNLLGWQAAACPRCRAQPGARCTSPRGRTLAEPHPSRLDTNASTEAPTWPYRPPQPQ